MEPLPSAPLASPLRVVVLSCGDLGIEISNALAECPGVDVVALVLAPWPRTPMSLTRKVKHVVRTQGWMGLAAVLGSKLRRLPEPEDTGRGTELNGGIPVVRVADFHSENARAEIAKLSPDLGVLAGTNILRKSTFGIPRLGSVNLHSGKTPEYRGAAPAFWELYNGESSVGITIHRVASALDAGDVLMQRSFPLDRAPSGDPLAYVEAYRLDVLRPNGIRMMAEVVTAIAGGLARPMAQDETAAHTYRSPDHRAIRELRRRVKQRQRGPG